MALVLSQDSGLLHSENNFKAPAEENAAKQKTKELDDCNTLSISPSSSSFNLFVRQAAAQFWSAVVCLCQMPKRLWNEEGQMKRGRVAVAVVSNHMHVHARTHTMSLQNPADSPHQWSLSIVPSLVSFTHPSLETLVKLRRATGSLIETALNWRSVKGSNRTTITHAVQDGWASQLPKSVCLCVLGLIRRTSWRGPELVPFSIKQKRYLS